MKKNCNDSAKDQHVAMKILVVSLLVLLPVILFPAPAMAYIDPGSGSAIVSVIIGFIVAIGLMFKTFWYKIKSCFSKKSPTDDK